MGVIIVPLVIIPLVHRENGCLSRVGSCELTELHNTFLFLHYSIESISTR
jgi:hypothetical protein